MYVLIPALINSEESESLLKLTLRHIPISAESVAVVVSQGRRPNLEKPANIKELIWKHYETPLTKWSAIVRARQVVPDNQTQVVLLDADDPIEPASFAKAISKCLLRPAICWIGRRSEIALHAADEFSGNSRFFIEMFSNTLLLNRVNPSSPVIDDPPDMQSGFYVLPALQFGQMTFKYVRDYGGELALCYQLLMKGALLENLDYLPQPRMSSSYRVQQILRQVFDLPFFGGLAENEIEEARTIAPVRYRRYFNQQRLAAYDHEIKHLLALCKSIGSNNDAL